MGTNVHGSHIAVVAVAALLAGCAHGSFSGGRGWSSASGGSFISTPSYQYAASEKQEKAPAKAQEPAKAEPAPATLASNAD